MNTQEIRQSLKDKWLSYYEENRQWLTKLGVWVSCDGQRRPSSGFILGTLSVLEPQFTELLPLIVDLSSNPDRIVVALGLNFNPDEQLAAIARANGTSHYENEMATLEETPRRMLPAGFNHDVNLSSDPAKAAALHSKLDESCQGRDRRDDRPLRK